MVSEIVKQRRHRAKRPSLSFYQERGRLEIDLVIEKGAELILVEVKAGRTPSSAHFSALADLRRLTDGAPGWAMALEAEDRGLRRR